MSLPSLLIGFILGVMALWIYLELIALAAKRKVPPPTLAARRKHTQEEREDGVNYRFMGVTGEE